MKDGMESGRVPAQAIQTALIAEKLFGHALSGVYLYGSATLGGLHPDSDLDILILIDEKLSHESRQILTERLLLLSGPVGNPE